MKIESWYVVMIAVKDLVSVTFLRQLVSHSQLYEFFDIDGS